MTQIVHRILLPIIFIFTAMMFLSVIAQVIFRYVLKQPLPWSEELARYLMVWVACLAGSEAYRMKSHVGVDFVARLLPVAPRKWVFQIGHMAVFVLMVVIIYQGVTLSWMLMEQESPALEIPMGWSYLAVPAGAAFIALHALIFFMQGLGKQVNET